ncbi:glycosyltransferase family 4 protein [Pseudochryseolinea flava]|nr:glycosyltransferase family 4 protein [Pseudochryseolinea flava]
MNQSDPKTWLQKIIFYTGIAEAMARKVKVESVHCIDYEGTLEQHDVTYHFLRLLKLGIVFPLRLHKYVSKLDADVVIVHGLIFPWQLIQLQNTLRKSSRIFVQHHAEKPLRFHKAFFQRYADQRIEGYFFTEAGLARPWIDAQQIKRNEKVHEVMEVSSSFQCTNVDRDKKRYLWVGRLDHNKDPLTLLNGFSIFLKKNPHCVLTIIFRGGTLRSEVEAIIKEERLSGSVILIEDVPHIELEHHYNQSSFVIATSHYEGSGTAVCEAMSCGCIPVLSEIPSFIFMTGRGKVGFLFERGNAQALANALEKSSFIDVEKYREQVLQQFSKHLSHDAIANKMLSVINDGADG